MLSTYTDLKGKTIKSYDQTHGECGIVFRLTFTDSTSITWMGTHPVYNPFVKGKKYKDWELSESTLTFTEVCYRNGDSYFVMKECNSESERLIRSYEAKGYTKA